jgi:hypothetical protein
MAKAIKHAALYVRVSAGPLLSSLGAADSRIAVDLRNVPAAVFGDLRELADLVLNRLVVRRIGSAAR